MLSDLRFALRQLAQSPGFTAVAVLTLALGIGMNTAMFSLLNGLLLRPLSYPQPERLFRLNEARPRDQTGDLTPANFMDVSTAAADVADFAAFKFWAFTLTEPDRPADVPVSVRVSANYFDVLGKPPALGRAFRPDEATGGRDSVLVISHQYWRTRFQSDPQIIGREVRLDGQPAEIIGVLPADDQTVRLIAPVAVFRPLVWREDERTNRKDGAVGIIGRYRPGVAPTQAAARFTAIGRQLVADHPVENANLALVARTLQSSILSGNGRTMTFLLIGLSGFVLLIACANLANLLLVRALSRAREFSIRGALGASRAQLIRPIFAECLCLAVIGGIAALLVSNWTTSWLAKQFGGPANPVALPVDHRVLLFMGAASLGTALLFGLAPAWWAARLDLNRGLQSGARGSTASRGQNRYRQALIATQFGLALVLLAGAGFFLRGLHLLREAPMGWNPDAVITGVLNLASGKYNAAEPILAFHAELRDRLLALPGVENAAVCFEVPMYPPPAQRNYLIEGRAPPAPGQELATFTNGVSASYFDTVGTRVLRGRAIDASDQLTTRPVVVINEAMARALFPEGDAVGQRLGVAGQNDPGWAEIVGVVEDTRPMFITPPSIRFQVYKPYTQEAWQYVTLAVRTSDAAKAPALLEPIRKVVASLDPDQPVMGLMTTHQRMDDNLGVWQTINHLLVIFATLGLLLSALGIYGVITRLVAQRTNEIGIRLALGAQVRDIVRLVVGSGLRMSLAGAGVGMLGAFFLARFLAKAMPAFGQGDLMPIVVASALLMLVALVACLLPARRATRVDPLIALRAE